MLLHNLIQNNSSVKAVIYGTDISLQDVVVGLPGQYTDFLVIPQYHFDID